MLRNVNDLYGFSIAASNGLIGQIRDCYFDDETWTIRFFVVETDQWLGGRKVLISPLHVNGFDRATKTLSASLTREQVKASPDVDTSKPVSRQHEVEQFGYYGHPIYWGEPQLWAGGTGPGMSLAGYTVARLPSGKGQKSSFVEALGKQHRERGDDPHLRSCRAIEMYHLHATDGDIGHVESFLLDDEAWDIRYLVVKTSDWWLGHMTLIAPTWIANIDWFNATLAVDLTRQAVKNAPTFNTNSLPDNQQEQRLLEYYGHLAH